MFCTHRFDDAADKAETTRSMIHSLTTATASNSTEAQQQHEHISGQLVDSNFYKPFNNNRSIHSVRKWVVFDDHAKNKEERDATFKDRDIRRLVTMGMYQWAAHETDEKEAAEAAEAAEQEVVEAAEVAAEAAETAEQEVVEAAEVVEAVEAAEVAADK